MTADPRAPVSPIEASCYWMAGRPERPVESLSGAIDADVAVVGGGFTGLWSALHLKALEPKLEVALLERDLAGSGASGRNAGIVGETLDHSHELAAKHFGLAEARRLARLGRENVDEMEAFLSARGIDAEWSRPGQLVFALTEKHVEELSRAVEFARAVGAPEYRLLSAEAARSEISSPLYRGALLAPRHAVVHPIKLVEGLRREAENRGVRIFERTPVSGFSFSRRQAKIGTDRGEVRARRVILATNAYTHLLFPRLLKRYLPLFDYIVVSEPLSAEDREAIGWRRRASATDARTFFNYYRLTSDDRILWGTSEAVYYRGNRVDSRGDRSPSHERSLSESFRRHFPQISPVEFPFAWGGPICSTSRLTPFFGSAHRGALLYGLGYTGHGIASTHLAGKLLAHMALEKESALRSLAMARKRPFPFPPEPLRGAAVAAVTKALRKVDAGGRPGLLLRALDLLGISFSS